MWYGSYTLEATGKLSLGLWEDADDGQPSPTTKRGGLVLVLESQGLSTGAVGPLFPFLRNIQVSTVMTPC
jgi:hypothetical protein